MPTYQSVGSIRLTVGFVFLAPLIVIAPAKSASIIKIFFISVVSNVATKLQNIFQTAPFSAHYF